jgi:hypothetical protein
VAAPSIAPSVTAIAPSHQLSYGSPSGTVGTGIAGTAGVNAIAGPGVNGVPGVSGGVSGQSGQALACKTVSADGKACLEPYYSIEAIYFNAKRYSSTADCLTAAHSMRLPLDMCR